MDANMLKHLAGKGINSASPLGRFLLTVQEVKKSIVLRKLAEEQESLGAREEATP